MVKSVFPYLCPFWSCWQFYTAGFCKTFRTPAWRVPQATRTYAHVCSQSTIRDEICALSPASVSRFLYHRYDYRSVHTYIHVQSSESSNTSCYRFGGVLQHAAGEAARRSRNVICVGSCLKVASSEPPQAQNELQVSVQLLSCSCGEVSCCSSASPSF